MTEQPAFTSSDVLLGIDIGTVRIGVATVRLDVLIAQPLTTLANDDTALVALQKLVQEYRAAAIVAGWPRGLEGQATAQTAYAEQFVEQIRSKLDIAVYLQDEALTSHQAEAELAGRGKPYQKEDVDSLAATYILQDYVQEHRPVLLAANGGEYV